MLQDGSPPFWGLVGSHGAPFEIRTTIQATGPPIQATGPPIRMQGWDSVEYVIKGGFENLTKKAIH